MTTFYVGKESGDYGKLSDAVRNSHDGDTIYMRAGVYADDPVTINNDVSIIGVGGRAHLQATHSISNGKALIISNADLYIRNLEISGAEVGDHNGAGIRQQYGNLTIESSYFHDNEDGILGHDTAGRTIIRDSEFARNGYGDGQSHGIYINNAPYLEVTGSYFHDTDQGHLIKSRAAETVIRDNVLDDGKADTSYSIDLPEGGKVTIADNTIIQGANGANRTFISYTGEKVAYSDNSLVIDNNIFANYDPSGKANSSVLLRNWRNPTTADISDNALYNISKLAVGKVDASDNKILTSPPKIDFKHPGFVDDPTSPTDPDTTPGTDEGTGNTGSGTGSSSGGSGNTDSGGTTPPGGDTDQTLKGTSAADRLTGGSGDDTIDGASGNDTIAAGAGNESARGGSGSDDMSGGAGNDTLYGDSQNDILKGEDGDDKLFGGAFSDVLIGGNGNDILAGNSGNDALIGGAGRDTAVYAGNFEDYNVRATSVYAPSDNPDYGKDSLSGIEILKFADGIYDTATGVFTHDTTPITDYHA